MTNTAPLQIIVAPFTIYTAAVGAAFPDVATTPPVAWTILGSDGDRDYDEDGIHITHEQTVDFHRFLGSTGPRKATRSEEGLRIEVVVHNMTLEQYAKAMNAVAVTAAAGPPATKSIPMYRGLDVAQYALLVRGASPYSLTGFMQYQVPVAVLDGEPEVIYNKTDPAGLTFSFYALEDPNAASVAARFGNLIAATT